MDDFEWNLPAELKGAYYHQWGLKRQGHDRLTEPEVRVDHYHVGLPSNHSITHGYFGLRDMIEYLGHDKLDMIDIFKIDCELSIYIYIGDAAVVIAQSTYFFFFSQRIFFSTMTINNRRGLRMGNLSGLARGWHSHAASDSRGGSWLSHDSA